MTDLSPEVQAALDQFGDDWRTDDEAKSRDALIAAVEASHPLVALWREWVAAKRERNVDLAERRKSAGWRERRMSADRLAAAERALLNYRSDT